MMGKALMYANLVAGTIAMVMAYRYESASLGLLALAGWFTALILINTGIYDDD